MDQTNAQPRNPHFHVPLINLDQIPDMTS